MPAVLRAGTNGIGTSSFTASLILNVPTVQPGDTIIIVCSFTGASTTFSAPGYTAQPAASATGGSMQQLTRQATGSEGATVTVTASSSGAWAAVICAYGGLRQSSPYDPAPAAGSINSSSTTVHAPSITPILSGDQLLWFGFDSSTSLGGTPQAITLPAGFTSRVTQANSSVGSTIFNSGLAFGDLVLGSAGATGSRDGSIASSAINGGLLISLAVAAADPVPQSPSQSRIRRYAPRVGRRGRIFHPPLVQGTAGVAFPLTVRKSGLRPRWLPRLRRGASFAPPWRQGPLPVQFPLTLRQGGSSPRWQPLIKRGHIWLPPFPQAGVGVRFPLMTRGQAGSRPRWAAKLRRGKFFDPRRPQSAQGSPWNLIVRPHTQRRPRWAPPRRVTASRMFAPPWPQGSRGVQLPLFTRQKPARTKMVLLRRSVGFYRITFPKRIVQATVSWSGASSMVLPGVVIKHVTITWGAASSMHIAPQVVKAASIHWAAASTMQVTARRTAQGTIHWTAASVLTAAGVVTRKGTISWSAASSMTAAASATPSLRMSAASSMSIGALVTVKADAAWSAASSMTVLPEAGRPPREILIEAKDVAPRDRQAETGSFERTGPVPGPAVITVDGLITGVYDDTD